MAAVLSGGALEMEVSMDSSARNPHNARIRAPSAARDRALVVLALLLAFYVLAAGATALVRAAPAEIVDGMTVAGPTQQVP